MLTRHTILGLECVAQMLASALWPVVLATSYTGQGNGPWLLHTMHLTPLRMCQLLVPSFRILLSAEHASPELQ